MLRRHESLIILHDTVCQEGSKEEQYHFILLEYLAKLIELRRVVCRLKYIS